MTDDPTNFRRSSLETRSPNRSSEPNWKQKYHDAKILYFQEFMKRLFFESKYINLCKLCEEYMEELLESLTSVVAKQKSINNRSLQIDDEENEGGLGIILEQTDEEVLESAKDRSIAYKIGKIQERIIEIEENDAFLVNKYRGELKDLANEMTQMANENECLRQSLEDIKSQLGDMKIRDMAEYDISRRRNTLTEREKELERKIETEHNNFEDMSKKFNTLQGELSHLQTYLKSLNLSQEQMEIEQLKKEYKGLKNQNGDQEGKINRLEKLLKDKDALIAELTRNLTVTEKSLSNANKEKETVTSQRNSAEARLKVVCNNLRTVEREKERLGSVILKKDQYIEKLEIENGGMANELNVEKRTSGSKLDEISHTLLDISKQSKHKDHELEVLRNSRVEYQNECQSLIKTIFEKDKEINGLIKDKEDMMRVMEDTKGSLEIAYKKKIEDNFANVMQYIAEKEAEVERLRKLINEKEALQSNIALNETRKLKDMESMLLNLSRELRQKEEENLELRGFIENYRSMLQELNHLNERA